MLIGVVFSFAAAQAGYSSWQLSAYAYAAGVITAAVVAGFLLARVSKTCHKVQIMRDEQGGTR